MTGATWLNNTAAEEAAGYFSASGGVDEAGPVTLARWHSPKSIRRPNLEVSGS